MGGGLGHEGVVGLRVEDPVLVLEAGVVFGLAEVLCGFLDGHGEGAGQFLGEVGCLGFGEGLGGLLVGQEKAVGGVVVLGLVRLHPGDPVEVGVAAEEGGDFVGQSGVLVSEGMDEEAAGLEMFLALPPVAGLVRVFEGRVL